MSSCSIIKTSGKRTTHASAGSLSLCSFWRDGTSKGIVTDSLCSDASMCTPHTARVLPLCIIKFLILWFMTNSRLSFEPGRTQTEFIIQAYGSVLAPLPPDSTGNPVQGNLSRALGSVVGSACLRAEGGVGAQQTSHVFGLLKARGVLQNQSNEDAWLSSDEGTEWVIRTIDEILDVVEDGTPSSADSPTTSQPRENREVDGRPTAKL